MARNDRSEQVLILTIVIDEAPACRGTATSETGAAVAFDGWLELLSAVARLAEPSGSGRASGAGSTPPGATAFPHGPD